MKNPKGIGLAGLLLFFIGIAWITMNHGYQISYQGEPVGFVQNLKAVPRAVDELREEFTAQYGEEIVFDDRIAFHYEAKKDQGVLAGDDLKEALLRAGMTPKIQATQIWINGEMKAVVESGESAQALLDEIVQGSILLNQGEILLESSLMDTVQLEDALVDAPMVEERSAVLERFRQGLSFAETYQVQPKDTLWDIAVNRGVSVTELQQANPGMEPAALRPGDLIVIQQQQALFHIRYRKEVVVKEAIPFAVEYTEDASLYQGQEKVATPGQEGIRENVYTQTFENGQLVDNQQTRTTEVKTPVTQVVARGTKAWPVQYGTGRFVVPASGRILGMYGSDRGSYNHKGVDICQWSGSARGVYAADSGTVTVAKPDGYNGGRGVYVEISHGNGLTTAYYHFASINVVQGQSVSQGQQIGVMGTTGNSVGIHLHFEVRVNGNNVDPNGYFGFFRNGLDVRALTR